MKKTTIFALALLLMPFGKTYAAASSLVRTVLPAARLHAVRAFSGYATPTVAMQEEATDTRPAVIGRVSSLKEMHEQFSVASSILFNPEEMLSREYYLTLPDRWGIWLRGVSDRRFQLIPSAQRLCDPTKPMSSQESYLDEAAMTRECMLITPEAHTMFNNPDLHRSIDEPVSWLTHLQHYEAATRLLDWTDNPDTALFFSVFGSTVGGRVFVINALRMNNYILGDRGFGVLPQDSLSISIRAQLSLVYRKEQLLTKNSILQHEEYKAYVAQGGNPSDLFEGLEFPLALEARRYNPRIQSQEGYFTIFGGKIMHPKMTDIPAPVTIEELNFRAIQEGHPPFLLAIDVDAPAEIREELASVDVTKESLLLSPEEGSQEQLMVDLYHNTRKKWVRSVIKHEDHEDIEHTRA